MGRLFIRVFLWFWGGSVALLLVFAATLVVVQPEAATTWRGISHGAMRALASQLGDVYEREGAAAARTALARVVEEDGLAVWLYASDGGFIAGPAPVDGAADVVQAALRTDGVERLASGGALLAARAASSVSGARYVIMWQMPGLLRGAGLVSPRFGFRLVALGLTAAVICWLLTWQITRPVRTLRAAARQFAEGNLSVRVAGGPGLGRRDELAELAQEFDRMASRIETSIASQQQLLADISHELRSPLARLSLALDLARRKVGTDLPEHDRIAREVERLDTLIGQLLTLARLQSDAGHADLESVDLLEVVRDVVHDARFEAEAAGKSVTIERECAASVRGSRALLRSAVENVVRNAVRHTPAQTAVSVSVDCAQDPGTVIVTVRDRGPGVPADALGRLFDPFFRVDEARDRESGGAGLGLAITKGAMLAHGGTASASNHDEGGLVVRLSLPASA